MILQVCAVFDMKARAFATPMVFGHINLAHRAMMEAVRLPDHPLSKYPEDFVLYRLGTWNDETGEYQLLEQKEYVSNALQYIRPTVEGNGEEKN